MAVWEAEAVVVAVVVAVVAYSVVVAVVVDVVVDVVVAVVVVVVVVVVAEPAFAENKAVVSAGQSSNRNSSPISIIN